jgi:hypothetical protein
MRRPVLVTVAILGLVIVLIGGTGLFAALTDTARTGTNTVDSAGLAASADLQLATATRDYPGPIVCGAYSENLASGFFTVADVVPGYNSPPVYFCVKNAGSQTVNLSAMVDELADLDTSCTGDEAVYDTTCGGNLAGDLSEVLSIAYLRYACDGSTGSGTGVNMRNNATNQVFLPGTLAPGSETCMEVDFAYSNGNTETQKQKAQSDRVTWRFKFGASLPA